MREADHFSRSSEYEHDIVRVRAAEGSTQPLDIPAIGKLAREMRIGVVSPKVKSIATNLVNGFMIRWFSPPESESGLAQRSWF